MIAPPILLAKTHCDLPKLLQLCKEVLGHSVSRNIDAKAIQNLTLKHLSALSEILDEESNFDTLLSDVGLLADQYHITIGLIIEDQIYIDLLHYRHLHIVGNDTKRRGVKLAIVTASLRGWRDSVIDGCNENITPDIRDVFTEIYNLLVSEDLGRLWLRYVRKRSTDGTMILVER
ncbi:MAG: hypothetical protein KGI50_07015 [Patescibacteria group bacterium]|nr:hypothetical protein [Patescibacteria group bacterium]MDE2439225.1 hypothetical protein [Patescibacteria group bacterium]